MNIKLFLLTLFLTAPAISNTAQASTPKITSFTESSLFDAVSQGNKTAIVALIRRKANINYQDESLGETPLHIACKKIQKESYEQFFEITDTLLLQKNIAFLKDRYGRYPLDTFVAREKHELDTDHYFKYVELLVSSGCPAHNPDTLKILKAKESEDIMTMLIAYKLITINPLHLPFAIVRKATAYALKKMDFALNVTESPEDFDTDDKQQALRILHNPPVLQNGIPPHLFKEEKHEQREKMITLLEESLTEAFDF